MSMPIADTTYEPMKGYNEMLNVVRVHSIVLAEALPILLSTLTIHCDQPSMLKTMSKIGPWSLRHKMTKLILYVHYNDYYLYETLLRISELTKTFPRLRHLRVNYHMRPPISYQNLLDAMYLTIPILLLPPPLDKPLFVVNDELLPAEEHRKGMVVDPRPGTTIYTTYMKQETLFEAHFLGDITTDDAIEDHTSVIRALFDHPDYVAAAKQVVAGDIVRDPANMEDIQQAVMHVARGFERPWFEKLQRRRMIQYYTGRGRSKEDAEAYLNRQLAELPGGQGIEVLIENLMQEEVNLQEFIA